MQFTRSQRKILDLSAREVAVNTAIETSPLTVAEIVEVTKLPRMTVYSVLSSLERRGIIQKLKQGKQVRYRSQDLKDIYALLSPHGLGLQQQLGDWEKRVHLQISESNEFILHQGKRNILDIYERLCRDHKRERFRGIQPDASVRKIFQKLTLDEINRVNEAISRNKLIVESIIEPTYFRAAHLSYSKEDFDRWINQFLKRLAIVYTVEREYLSFRNELIMFRDTVFLIDWGEESAVEIKNAETVLIFTTFFELLLSLAHKTEFSTLAKDYLAK